MIPDALPATLGDPAPTVVPPSERADMIGHAREVVSFLAAHRVRGGYSDIGTIHVVDMLPGERAVLDAACAFLAREFNRGYRDSHDAPKVKDAPTPEASKAIVS